MTVVFVFFFRMDGRVHVKDAFVWGGTIDVRVCGDGRGRSWWFERRERAFLDHEEAALALSRAREGAPVRSWGIYATNRHDTILALYPFTHASDTGFPTYMFS